MTDDFYRVFENQHRGSRELIKSRQRVYLPFIEPLRSIYSDAKAIDLGCGRGEWLELLEESGFNALGVDLDDGMLASCRELGLNVATTDALVALKALPDASQIVVSGFHIAEHMQFSDLQTLVQEALRVLKPAGLLILETPNPENMVVGTVNFYLDPTHQRPIPPRLLSFLPEYYGFAMVKIIRLHEDKALLEKSWISLHDVLNEVSPDYAIVAQKSADTSLLLSTNEAYAQEYGLTLGSLTERFDRQTAQTATLARETYELVTRVEIEARQARERAESLDQNLHAIYNSRSWRITAPLRKMNHIFHTPVRQSLRSAVVRITPLILKSPVLTRIIKAMLHRSPWLRSIAARLRGAESISYSVRTFDDLVSIKVMDAMSHSISNGDMSQSVIFLQVPHAR